MKLFSTLEVCPQFCAAILGEPDYWAPLAVRSRDKTGIVFRVGMYNKFIVQTSAPISTEPFSKLSPWNI